MIALITYHDNGTYHTAAQDNEDDLLIHHLNRKGFRIEKVVWNDPSVHWESYALVLLKSPWDYFNRITDFYAWLSRLKQKNIRVLNPLEVLRWNADKHYLKDIEAAGLAVVNSAFLEKGSLPALEPYFEHFHTQKLIVKPAVSGGSKNTFKISSENVHVVREMLHVLLQEEAFMIQPFLPEISEEGEWSFLFFGGKFSHALLKKAKPGDFRVQHSFGGTIHPQQPTTAQISTAQQYVEKFANDCLYARVDGVFLKNEFHLMELELIEPFLFLEADSHSFERYSEALIQVVETSA